MDQNFVEALKLQLKQEIREEIKAEVKAEIKEEFKAELKLQLIKDKSIVNTVEAAHILGLQPRTVRKLNEEGKINGRKYKKSGYWF
jgi:hypothetical protein